MKIYAKLLTAMEVIQQIILSSSKSMVKYRKKPVGFHIYSFVRQSGTMRHDYVFDVLFQKKIFLM